MSEITETSDGFQVKQPDGTTFLVPSQTVSPLQRQSLGLPPPVVQPGPPPEPTPEELGLDPHGAAAQEGQEPFGLAALGNAANRGLHAIFPLGPVTPPGPETPPAPAALPPQYDAALKAPQPQPPSLGVPQLQFPDPTGALQGAARQAMTAETEAAKAKGEAAAKQADILQRAAAWREEASQRTQKILSDRTQEYQRIVDDIKGSKIDPMRAWSSRGAGEKASATIGLILSGIGSGLTGQPNLAMEVIQKQIDRDIDAQKMELGKKENLLSAHFRQTGDIMQAEQLARADKAAMIQGQLESAAAQSGSAVAMAEAKKFGAMLQLQIIPQVQQYAMFRAQMDMMRQNFSGGPSGRYEEGSQPSLPKGFGFEHIAEAQNIDRGRELPPVQAGGKPVLARDAPSAEKARDRIAGLSAFEDALGKLEQTKASGIPLMPGTKDYDRILTGASAELARAMYGGSPGENQIKEARTILVGPLEAAVRGQGSFESARQIAQGQRKAIYTTYAGVPASRFVTTRRVGG